METINGQVAQLIASAILNQNRSKKSVAEASGIPLTTLDRKLKGNGRLTIVEIARIADALDIHPARLFPAEFLAAA